MPLEVGKRRGTENFRWSNRGQAARREKAKLALPKPRGGLVAKKLYRKDTDGHGKAVNRFIGPVGK